MYSHQHQQPTQRPRGRMHRGFPITSATIPRYTSGWGSSPLFGGPSGAHRYPTSSMGMSPSFLAPQHTCPTFPDGFSLEGYPRRQITTPYYRAHQSFPDPRSFEERPRQQVAGPYHRAQRSQEDALARNQHRALSDIEAAEREQLAAARACDRAREDYHELIGGCCGPVPKGVESRVAQNVGVTLNRLHEVEDCLKMARDAYQRAGEKFQNFAEQFRRDERLANDEDHESITRGQHDRAARPRSPSTARSGSPNHTSFRDAHTPDSRHRRRRDGAKLVDEYLEQARVELAMQQLKAMMEAENLMDETQKRDQHEKFLRPTTAKDQPRMLRDELGKPVDPYIVQAKEELEIWKMKAKLEAEDLINKTKKREQARQALSPLIEVDLTNQHVIITNPKIWVIAKSGAIINSREFGPDDEAIELWRDSDIPCTIPKIFMTALAEGSIITINRNHMWTQLSGSGLSAEFTPGSRKMAMGFLPTSVLAAVERSNPISFSGILYHRLVNTNLYELEGRVDGWLRRDLDPDTREAVDFVKQYILPNLQSRETQRVRIPSDAVFRKRVVEWLEAFIRRERSLQAEAEALKKHGKSGGDEERARRRKSETPQILINIDTVLCDQRKSLPALIREDATLSDQESSSTDQSDDESTTSSEQESSSANQSNEPDTDRDSSVKKTISHHSTVETAPDLTVEDRGSKVIPDSILRSSESDDFYLSDVDLFDPGFYDLIPFSPEECQQMKRAREKKMMENVRVEETGEASGSGKIKELDDTHTVEKEEEAAAEGDEDGEKKVASDADMAKSEDVEGKGKGKAE